MKWKNVIVLSIVMIMVVAGFSEAAAKKSSTSRKRTTPAKPAVSQKAPAPKKTPAPITSDDIAAEEMLKMAELLRKVSMLEKGIPLAQESRDKRIAQLDEEIVQVNAEIEQLTLRIEELEQKILDLEDMRDAVEDSEADDDSKIEEEQEAVQNQVDDIADRLFVSFDVMPEYVNAFNPKATSQIVEWTMTKDDETEVERLSLTLLHNRKTQKLTRQNVTSHLTDSGDIFFTLDNLPEGVQIVIPREAGRTWTIKADGRVGNKKFDSKGYFVARIKDPEDIAYSELDGDSNITEDGSKTFTSGEAFIILRKSSITIYLDEKH